MKKNAVLREVVLLIVCDSLNQKYFV